MDHHLTVNDNKNENAVVVSGAGIPSVVTNSSPASLHVSTSEIRNVTNHTDTAGICSSGDANNNNNNNVDTTVASISNDSSNSSSSKDSCCIATTTTTTRTPDYYCAIRASGQVCICDRCEAVRLQLLLTKSNLNVDGNSITLSTSKSNTLPQQQQPSRTTVPTTTTTTASSNKRRRDEYNNNKNKKDDDDDDNDDDDNFPSSTDVSHHHNGNADTTPSTIAVATRFVTTTASGTAASTDVLPVDSEQQTLEIMSSACRTILQCIGEDPDREGLQKTPQRWAKALLYLCHGYHLSPSQVTNNAVFYENHNEMVVVRNIDIHSLCEHHMVPFTGHVHIGYIPNGKIIGLSKLARLADLFARRLQVQERLTRQIADAILETITPLGVAVVMECTHYCMVMRGVQKTGTITTTSSVRGCFETNSKTRAEFFSILHGGR